LKVGAFDVADLSRAAWVQAVPALDHWVHRELYDRALAFALQTSVPRPTKFLQIPIPVRLFEDVRRRSATLPDAFGAHLRSLFGYQSFQAPEKIKQALSHVSEVSLWPGVAKWLSAGPDSELTNPEQVQARLSEIVRRRNRIAHETDRDPSRHGGRSPISDGETTEAIDWIERAATAILAVLGPPPVPEAADISGHRQTRGRDRQVRPPWTRVDIDQAVARIDDPKAAEAVRRLLAHADARGALIRGGVSLEPSAGIYYWLRGNRRSLWSLYLNPDRPQIALNFGSVWPRDPELARRMVAEIRRIPALDAALLHSDDVMVRKYPGVDLATLARSPDAVVAIIAALDLVDQTEHHTAGTTERRASIPDRLVAHRALADGQQLTIVVPDGVAQDRPTITAWLDADPSRCVVEWRDDAQKPLAWRFDGDTYSMAGLIRELIRLATGHDPQADVWGPNWIQTRDGMTLAKLAEPLDL
jgi:hypothetical protein